MTDILGMGINYNIKGKSGYFYEGILFDRSEEKNSHPDGKHLVMEVEEFDETIVKKYKTLGIFDSNELPLDKITTEKYFILDNKPRFGRSTTIDEFPFE